MKNENVSRRLDENLSVLESQLGYEITFDLLIRKLKVAHKQAALEHPASGCYSFFLRATSAGAHSLLRSQYGGQSRSGNGSTLVRNHAITY